MLCCAALMAWSFSREFCRAPAPVVSLAFSLSLFHPRIHPPPSTNLHTHTHVCSTPSPSPSPLSLPLLAQNVTLGGTGKDHGDRHPKISDNVLIGACATVLGNIRVGEGAQIAAGSLVLKPVAPHTMVAGSPAKPVGHVTGGWARHTVDA